MKDFESKDLVSIFSNHSQVIKPPFPNWERSFISGTDSPLFEIEHRITNDNVQILLSRVRFKAKAEGPPGHVHGGASAAFIDETMGVLVWYNQFSCVTQNLNLRYQKALPLATEVYALTEIAHVHDRTIEVVCTLYDKEKTPYVTSQGVFHRLRSDQLKKFAKNESKD